MTLTPPIAPPAGATVVAEATWTETHPARFGAPAGTDHYRRTIAARSFACRTYYRETTWINGVVLAAAEYPAGTEYAAKRVAEVNRLAAAR